MSTVRVIMIGMTSKPRHPGTEKPILALLRAPLTPKKLAAMYERLTGRKMTPEALARAEKQLADT